MASNIPLTMRAIALAKYCKPSEYGLSTLPIPQITRPDEVLIKVHAASINPIDVKMASGLGKMLDPNVKFPYKIGYDLSGTIAAVGSAVTTFTPGDEVYSRIPDSHRGAFAQYALSPVSFVAFKPKSLSHNEAASIPLAAQTALQSLRLANSKLPGGLAGKTVFIPGGLSGTGSFAVQIAKNYFHAGKVVTTLSPKKIEILNEVLGKGVVDQVVDYTKGAKSIIEAVGKGSVDFMFDPVGQTIPLVEVMKPGGVVLSISTVPSGAQMQVGKPDIKWYLVLTLNVLDWALRTYMGRWWGMDYAWVGMVANGEDLKTLAEMIDKKELKPVLGEVVKLEDLEGVRRVCDMVLSGKGGLGKFVIEIE